MSGWSKQVASIVVFGDLHAALTAPASRLRYAEDIERAVADVCALADRVGAGAVGCTGDLFHRKGSTTHREVLWLMRLLAPLREKFGPLLCVLGNHDMQGDNAEHAAREQPIGVLVEAGLVRLVEGSPVAVGPFLVVGANYRRDPKAVCRSLLADASRFVESGAPLPRAVVAMTHCDALPGGDLAKRLIASATGGGWVAPQAVVVNGHLHDARGASRHSLKCKGMKVQGSFVAAGSVSRTSVAERDSIPRAVVVRDGAGGVSIREVSLDCVPATEAFADEVPAADGGLPSFAPLLAELSGSREALRDPAALVRAAAQAARVPAGVAELAARAVAEAV